jgi:glycine cleavage system H protein
VAGTVVAGNGALASQPELINQEPYGGGWLMRLKPASAADVGALMDATAYGAFLASEA